MADGYDPLTEHMVHSTAVREEAEQRKMPQNAISYSILTASRWDVEEVEFRLGMFSLTIQREQLTSFIPFIRMESTDCGSMSYTYMYILNGSEYRFDQTANIVTDAV